MYTGEEIIHTTARENLSFASGWLFLSIALGSVLTFTFFTAISTSFYCCQKPIKKNDEDTQSLINTGNSSQKLLFPSVPSTVYPTTQSILQQEDNEVIDSLSPAYRELPSTHFSYVSSFNGSITVDSHCCGNNQSTILPNSTKSSIHSHTQSSEQLNMQRLSNDCTISQQNTSNPEIRNNSSRSTYIIRTNKDSTISQQSSTSTNPDLIDESSLSVHIITVPQDLQRCVTSSTSGITTEEDLKIQRESNELSGQIIKSTRNDDLLNEPTLNDDQRSKVPARKDSRLNESVINNDQRLATNEKRLSTEICGPVKNAATSSAKNTNHDEITSNSSRGASSFGGVELSPKTRAFSPDYYALTFRREGSGLSDVSPSSQRGASVFAGSSDQRRSPIMISPSHERGASVFGRQTKSSFVLNGTAEPNRHWSEYHTQKSLLNYAGSQLGTERSCTIDEDTPEIPNYIRESPISEKAVQISPNPTPDHSAADITVNSVHSENSEANFSKLQSPTGKNMSVASRRPNSNTSTNSYKEKVELGETGIISQQHGTTSRDSSKPMKTLDTKNNLKTQNLNTTYQSLRGASQLGCLGDDDVCSDCDALWDSVSLSFAYESVSEEDVMSHFGFKEN